MSMWSVLVTIIAFTFTVFTVHATVTKIDETLTDQLINSQLASSNVDNNQQSESKNGDTSSYLHKYSKLLDTLVGSYPGRSSLIGNRLSSIPGQWFLLDYPLAELSDKRTSQSFTPWAGKRSRSSDQGKRVFHSWAGKRAIIRPFSDWAGKRSSIEDNDQDTH